MEGRRIVSVSIGDCSYIIALCEDGTVWFRRGVWNNSDPWCRLPPIPKDEQGDTPQE